MKIHFNPLAPHGNWLVQCDFDGTISTVDVTDSLLERFARPGWRELEQAWDDGKIGSRECMKGQVALFDMSRAELQAHLAGIQVDAAFYSFVAAARRMGVTVQVVSDGLDMAISTVLARHGLEWLPVMANRLVQLGERSWRMESPHASAHCKRASGNCKCERLAEHRPAGGSVLYVGDGASDYCVAHTADYVLAKHKLIGHCVRNAIAHAPFTDFDEATRLLTALVTSGAGRAESVAERRVA